MKKNTNSLKPGAAEGFKLLRNQDEGIDREGEPPSAAPLHL